MKKTIKTKITFSDLLFQLGDKFAIALFLMLFGIFTMYFGERTGQEVAALTLCSTIVGGIMGYYFRDVTKGD